MPHASPPSSPRSPGPNGPAGEGGWNAPTLWGQVRNLRRDRADQDAGAWRAAWEHLVQRYRPVMVSYAGWLLRRGGGQATARNDAEEVVDSFLAACFEKDWLDRADPEMGRFRTFVRVLLARWIRDWLRHRHAARRRPESGAPTSLDPLVELVGQDQAAALSELFAQEWAETVYAAALAQVRARSDVNARVLEAVGLEGTPDPALVAARARIPARQVPVRVTRARRMMAEELWAETKRTVTDPVQLDDERRLLSRFIGHYMDPAANPSFFGPDEETA